MDYSLNKATEEVLAVSLEQETRNFIRNFLKGTFDWYDLAQEWRNHQFSYNEKSDISEKSKHAIWAKKQAESIGELLEPSRKFLSQLDKLFASETFDINHISDRIHAAFNYFFVPMDNAVYDILWKLEEVKRVKKVKAYYEELLVLEELQIKAVLQLMKAKLLVNTVVSGTTISKENLTSEEIKSYRINKIASIQAKFKELNISLVEDDFDVDRYANKKASKSKEPKKSTVQETYELWQQKNSIKEIAEIRKFTEETILGHLTKLITAKTISISDILPEDKILELTEAFKGYSDESISPLKEKYGEKFSWNELRMFKASLN
jgi:uncharacterized protein YpbB